jgi:NADH:ubiquinone oxidoreductase subunit F (NADH-binding)/Pyruvate/2-oxoacid:ferredoxin oxidoreductase delta subunit
LIEVPMGITLRQIVEEIGGGVQQPKEPGMERSAVPGQKNVRKFKAVQIGGPSGGCVPEHLADTPVDFESLAAVGAIMGSGGLVVLDDQDCMVDIARYFLKFTQEQSCGKCTFCRIGTRRMLDILDRLCEGNGKHEDLTALETLAEQVKAGSLCGLGKTAPNPVLSTLRYFRSEYEAHVRGECPAGKCSALIKYQIDESCNGCSICVRHCPVSAIPATPYRRHSIDNTVCTKCDACRKNCPHGAVAVVNV